MYYMVLEARRLPLCMLSKSMNKSWMVKVNKDWVMFDKWKAKGTNNIQHPKATQKINLKANQHSHMPLAKGSGIPSTPLSGVQWPLATLRWNGMNALDTFFSVLWKSVSKCSFEKKVLILDCSPSREGWMAPGSIEGTSKKRGQTLNPQSPLESSDKAPPSKVSIPGQTPVTDYKYMSLWRTP